MPTHGQRLCEEVSHVPYPGNVLHSELEAANPILEPMKTHVAGLRHFWLDGAIGTRRLHYRNESSWKAEGSRSRRALVVLDR